MKRDPRPILAAVALIAASVLAFFGPGRNDGRMESALSAERDYVAADVFSHASADDCWLVIDGLVFDVTAQSKLHPSMFNCGQDVSRNYHDNHGPAIRDKMMVFRIGTLEDSMDTTNEVQETAKPDIDAVDNSLHPERELMAELGSWEPSDLMVVMERDNESLLFIDSKTHTSVGRIRGVGERVHTQVFSPDGRTAYHISRDGWLTKIDLRSLNVIGALRVGTDSRGTAITRSGKYVAVGNYEPQDVVIVDVEKFEIVARRPVTDPDGVPSRAGGLVDSGELFVVALKDARSTWVIDAGNPGFPVTKRFSGIGEPGDVLHDSFVTPDGRYFITAVQGSDAAWVLDLEMMEEVGEVPTGKTPHTGPGAAWGDLVFVPSLGENALAAIDTVSWKLRELIRTSGAGLFVRSQPPHARYPYLWSDSAFGAERQDTIDIIDARSLTVIKKLIPMEGKRAVHPEFTPDGRFVYVAVWGGNKVFVYDATTFEKVTDIDAITPSGISSVGVRVEEPGL